MFNLKNMGICALVMTVQARSHQEKLYDLMQLQSDPICSSAGCEQFKHPEKEEEPPKDYFVPNFGQDSDIIHSLNSERVASKLVGHNWKFKTDDSLEKYRNKALDTDYNFAPALDGDMKDSLTNQRSAEGRLGMWDMGIEEKE